MSLADVITGMVSRWSDQSMDSTITGGLHLDEVAKDTSMPYAVLTDLGESTRLRAANTTAATASHYRARQVQIRVHANTGPSAMAVLADSVLAAFEYAPLTLSGGTMLYCRMNSNIFTKDPAHENAWMWAGTFDVLYGITQALAPA